MADTIITAEPESGLAKDIATVCQAFTTAQEKADRMRGWIQGAPHLRNCPITLGFNKCRCGRSELLGDPPPPSAPVWQAPPDQQREDCRPRQLGDCDQ